MQLFNKKNKQYAQIFQLFTEESWTLNSKKFNKNISLLFSGKKHEVFIETNEKTITYYIGLGKETLQNFEFQQIGVKFSQTQKKNIQTVPTLLISEFINSQNEARKIYSKKDGFYQMGKCKFLLVILL